MSAITIGGDLIHYEKLGRGRPVILLHGWIGSWRYWIPLMQKLHTSFSVYTLDLVGFGDSSKNAEHYDIKSQVTMLEQFLLQLGIPKAAMIGHGLGTLVLTQFALKNPDKVARMLLTSIPLFEPADLKSRIPAGTPQKLTNNDRYSLSPRIEDIPEATQLTDATVANTGSSLDKTLVSGSGSKSGMYSPFSDLPTLKRSEVDKIDRDALRRAAEERQRKQNQDNELSKAFKGNQIIDLLGQCFKKTEPEYEKLRVDVEKTDDSILQETAKDYNAGTLLDDLRRITAPIVAVHGENDPIFKDPKPAVWDYLLLKKEDVFLPIVLNDVRHFPMLESEAFARLSTDFLTVPDITKIEVRDRWRRRSR